MELPHHHHDNSNILSEHMPSADDFGTVSSLFRQLGDTSRLRIFWLLCHTEECVINIAAMVGMSSPAVAHHLKLLKEAGLIEGRKSGKEMYYKSTDTPEAEHMHVMIEELMAIACPKC